jgi:hypothetical protein
VLSLPIFDEDLVRAALALTRAGVTTETQAKEIFQKVARSRGASVSTLATYDWDLGQEWVQKTLPQVARFTTLTVTGRQRLLTDLNERLVALTDRCDLQVGQEGIEIRSDEFDSIGAACTRALIPFVVPNGWPPSRLGRCQNRRCGIWFLRPSGQRGSVPLYCSARHANSERVMSFRDRRRAR